MYIVVAGAGHMGTHLVSRLIAAGHETVVIDVDKEVTERLFAEHGVVVFTGSATDVNVLDQAGIKRAAVAVAMTGRDPDNLAFCLLARYYGVPRVLARMLNPQYQVPYRLVGATKIHSEADILVESFLTSIDSPEVGALMPVGKGDIVVFDVAAPHLGGAGKAVAAVVRLGRLPAGCLFIATELPNGVQVIEGNTVIAGGARVIMAAHRPDLPKVLRYLTATDRPRRRGPGGGARRPWARWRSSRASPTRTWRAWPTNPPGARGPGRGDLRRASRATVSTFRAEARWSWRRLGLAARSCGRRPSSARRPSPASPARPPA